MPLFTYVVSYKGGTYVAQDRKSNFKGWWSSWTSDIPAGALPALTNELKRELAKPWLHGDDWAPVPNRANVWKKAFLLNESEFCVYAVQTAT
jgi:hypothetical protein